MCQRSMNIIPGLLRSKNNLESQMEEKENELKKMKRSLFMTRFLLVVVVVVVVWLFT